MSSVWVLTGWSINKKQTQATWKSILNKQKTPTLEPQKYVQHVRYKTAQRFSWIRKPGNVDTVPLLRIVGQSVQQDIIKYSRWSSLTQKYGTFLKGRYSKTLTLHKLGTWCTSTNTLTSLSPTVGAARGRACARTRSIPRPSDRLTVKWQHTAVLCLAL